jgi:hypothetical protein
MQAVFHEKALGLESERQATYRRIESDEAPQCQTVLHHRLLPIAARDYSVSP